MRWFALLECIHIIDKKSQKLNLTDSQIDRKFKPHIIRDYIENRIPSLEKSLGDFNTKGLRGFIGQFLNESN